MSATDKASVPLAHRRGDVGFRHPRLGRLNHVLEPVSKSESHVFASATGPADEDTHSADSSLDSFEMLHVRAADPVRLSSP